MLERPTSSLTPGAIPTRRVFVDDEVVCRDLLLPGLRGAAGDRGRLPGRRPLFHELQPGLSRWRSPAHLPLGSRAPTSSPSCAS